MEDKTQPETGDAEVQLPPESIKDLSPDEDQSEKVKGGAFDTYFKIEDKV